MNTEQQNQISAGKPKSKYWKFVFGFLGIIVLVLVGYPLVRDTYYSYKVNRTFKNYQEFETQYFEALRNDTYGGETPQETYEMFIDTLKKGDILNAAKFTYYTDEARIVFYKKLKKLQDEERIEEWVDELPKWEDMKEEEYEYWDKSVSIKNFEYERYRKKEEILEDPFIEGEKIILPAGEYTQAIIFMFSKSANIWKIYTFAALNIIKL